MTNSWSFLFDELNMSNQDYYEDDGFSVVGTSGTESPDTIVFSGSHLMGDNHITLTTEVPNTSSRQKYSEDVIIKELKDYITRTYDQHYSAGSDKIQTLDLIEACGDGEAFCRSNICLLYTSPSPRDGLLSRMPSSA